MAAIAGPEPLTGQHDRSQFDCGSSAQTDWLRKHALLALAQETARVYVVRPTDEMRVVGYYALAVGSVEQVDAPTRVLKGAGRYPVPIILLARLGVDLSIQRRGIGRMLVADTLRRVVQAADIVGARALLIHAENDAAKAYYLGLAEFEESPTDSLHLFLLMRDVRAALAP